jgi:hypothetical protein
MQSGEAYLHQTWRWGRWVEGHGSEGDAVRVCLYFKMERRVRKYKEERRRKEGRRRS